MKITVLCGKLWKAPGAIQVLSGGGDTKQGRAREGDAAGAKPGTAGWDNRKTSGGRV